MYPVTIEHSMLDHLEAEGYCSKRLIYKNFESKHSLSI